VPPGTLLAQGAVYVDLQGRMLREITATDDMTAGPNNWYVPKKEVDYRLWNRVIGIDISLPLDNFALEWYDVLSY
jgi:hypothetical protein